MTSLWITIAVLVLVVGFLLVAIVLLEKRVARLERPNSAGHIPGGE